MPPPARGRANTGLADIVQSTTEGHTVYGTFDRYLGSDHAFGGGIDVNTFSIVISESVLKVVHDAHRALGFDLESNGVTFIKKRRSEDRAVGRVLRNLYPSLSDPCIVLRLMFGEAVGDLGRRGSAMKLFSTDSEVSVKFQCRFSYNPSRHYQQSGRPVRGWIEVRITPHIGWMNDFSWNIMDPKMTSEWSEPV